VGEEALKGLHHAGRETDLIRGDHPRDRQRRADEDGQDQRHGQEDGLRVLASRIPEFVDVHGIDFDAGVGEKGSTSASSWPAPVSGCVLASERANRRVAGRISRW